MKVYLAGKITGDPGYREKFSTAKSALEQTGHIVLSPAELPEGMKPEDYMRICFSMIDSADVVVFLPDWFRSRGASLEYEYCAYIGKQTEFVECDAEKIHESLS